MNRIKLNTAIAMILVWATASSVVIAQAPRQLSKINPKDIHAVTLYVEGFSNNDEGRRWVSEELIQPNGWIVVDKTYRHEIAIVIEGKMTGLTFNEQDQQQIIDRDKARIAAENARSANDTAQDIYGDLRNRRGRGEPYWQYRLRRGVGDAIVREKERKADQKAREVQTYTTHEVTIQVTVSWKDIHTTAVMKQWVNPVLKFEVQERPDGRDGHTRWFINDDTFEHLQNTGGIQLPNGTEITERNLQGIYYVATLEAMLHQTMGAKD